MNHFDKISSFSKAIGIKAPEHPLFSISFGNKDECGGDDIEFSADFFIISFQQLESGNITHGRTKFDHDRGKLLFVKPRQTVTFKNIKLKEECFLILIHEDFLAGAALHHEIKKYGYFDYETNEALYLSPSEEEVIWSLVSIMDKENHNNKDDFTKTILLSHLTTLLKYAHRFYKRQFINRAEITGAIATRFHDLLRTYFETKKILESGLPTVSFMAEKLNLSSRYLSDSLKQETGKTALELIHLYIITEAKNLLKEGKLNIAEISYSLGFENPTYFSRLFKKEAGVSPNYFRDHHLN
ncbi:helix-turn-helix transcriptional regulator [Mucilaginibacter sp. cycad4]|uniref:helix-turn-helix domain-containing protein n=1 Tax=Mucilaginibacter sp. cycad4 TaxID=3342096 RepID=UPI002AAB1D5C|nr:helix-turn-helix transcriptional regulator [Mucilaginibacter gossypii]WPU97890.1 helix-turn-helix transcriptional regulator [Mucilaginibacter gossypii]